MAPPIITPPKSWWEQLKDVSPQVKAALIAGGVTVGVAVVTLIVGWIGASNENSRLHTKVHDLELEIAPFRNLAVQEFRSADAASLKKLAELMATLRVDYATQLNTINNLRGEIGELRKEKEELDRKYSAERAQENFVPLAEKNKAQFVHQLRGFFQKWPGVTNVGLIVDGTEKTRRLWAGQIQKIIADERLPVPLSAGMNMEKGAYDLVIFYGEGLERAAEEIAIPLTNLFRIPLTIYHRTNEPNPITVRLMGDPLFETNGVIHFK